MSLQDFGLNPYVDHRTGNSFTKVGARSAEELKIREGEFINIRLRELKENPIQCKYDLLI